MNTYSKYEYSLVTLVIFNKTSRIIRANNNLNIKSLNNL